MAYKLNKTGKQVEADLNAVEEKTIYPIASTEEDGLMSVGDKRELEKMKPIPAKVEDLEVRIDEMDLSNLAVGESPTQKEYDDITDIYDF